MRSLLRLVALFVVGASPVRAHYNMLHPAAASGKKDEAVTFTYQWGHPFEHQLFDAPNPDSVTVLRPDGKMENLTKTLEKVDLPAADGKTVVGYRFSFTPNQRGDYVFVLQTPPIWMEEDGEYLEDTVKVIYHVQAQKGWDTAATEEFEWLPLTRPYGLEPGMVFQARIQRFPKTPAIGVQPLQPITGATVEVERYNAVAPKSLPPDEHVTRVVKTDPNGIATCTLTDPGWWCITTSRGGGTRKHDGKDVPLRRRSTLWVFVDEKAK